MVAHIVRLLRRYRVVREFYRWRVHERALICARVDAQLSRVDPPISPLTRWACRQVRGVLKRHDPWLADEMREIRRLEWLREFTRRVPLQPVPPEESAVEKYLQTRAARQAAMNKTRA